MPCHYTRHDTSPYTSSQVITRHHFWHIYHILAHTPNPTNLSNSNTIHTTRTQLQLNYYFYQRIKLYSNTRKWATPTTSPMQIIRPYTHVSLLLICHSHKKHTNALLYLFFYEILFCLYCSRMQVKPLKLWYTLVALSKIYHNNPTIWTIIEEIKWCLVVTDMLRTMILEF